MKQNKDSFQTVLDWAKLHNIEASCDYKLFGCFDGSCDNLGCRLNTSEVEYVIRNLKEEKQESHINSFDDGLGFVCPVCRDSLCISHTGDVYPCEGWQSFILGNINNIELRKIWEDSLRVKELRELSYDAFPKCRNCVERDYCSICLIRNANESKTMDYKEVNTYFCEIARMKKNYEELLGNMGFD